MIFVRLRGTILQLQTRKKLFGKGEFETVEVFNKKRYVSLRTMKKQNVIRHSISLQVAYLH